MTRGKALFGRRSAMLGFECEELTHEFEHLACAVAAGFLPGIVEAPPGMRPAGHFLEAEVAIVGPVLIDTIEALVGIGVHVAIAVIDETLRILARASLGMAIEGRGSCFARPWPLVSDHAPQATLTGTMTALLKDRHLGIVDMEDGATACMRADRIGQRLQQGVELGQPSRQNLAREMHTSAGVNRRLPIERKVIGVFRDDYMCEQRRPGPTAFDRKRRHRHLHHPLARAATHTRTDMFDNLEAGGHIFQHFAPIDAALAEAYTATVRATRHRVPGRERCFRFECRGQTKLRRSIFLANRHTPEPSK